MKINFVMFLILFGTVFALAGAGCKRIGSYSNTKGDGDFATEDPTSPESPDQTVSGPDDRTIPNSGDQSQAERDSRCGEKDVYVCGAICKCIGTFIPAGSASGIYGVCASGIGDAEGQKNAGAHFCGTYCVRKADLQASFIKSCSKEDDNRIHWVSAIFAND